MKIAGEDGEGDESGSFCRRLPDVPVEIKPETVRAHKTTDFVQSMGAAIDLVTRNERHSGMVFIL